MGNGVRDTVCAALTFLFGAPEFCEALPIANDYLMNSLS